MNDVSLKGIISRRSYFSWIVFFCYFCFPVFDKQWWWYSSLFSDYQSALYIYTDYKHSKYQGPPFSMHCANCAHPNKFCWPHRALLPMHISHIPRPVCAAVNVVPGLNFVGTKYHDFTDFKQPCLVQFLYVQRRHRKYKDRFDTNRNRHRSVGADGCPKATCWGSTSFSRLRPRGLLWESQSREASIISTSCGQVGCTLRLFNDHFKETHENQPWIICFWKIRLKYGRNALVAMTIAWSGSLPSLGDVKTWNSKLHHLGWTNFSTSRVANICAGLQTV